MDVDYKVLLLKYVEHVSYNEGIDFLAGAKGENFTDEEWEQLVELVKLDNLAKLFK